MNKDISILKEIETYLTDKYKFTEEEKYRGVFKSDFQYYLSLEKDQLSTQMYANDVVAHIDLNKYSDEDIKFIEDKVKGTEIIFFVLHKGFING